MARLKSLGIFALWFVGSGTILGLMCAGLSLFMMPGKHVEAIRFGLFFAAIFSPMMAVPMWAISCPNFAAYEKIKSDRIWPSTFIAMLFILPFYAVIFYMTNPAAGRDYYLLALGFVAVFGAMLSSYAFTAHRVMGIGKIVADYRKRTSFDVLNILDTSYPDVETRHLAEAVKSVLARINASRGYLGERMQTVLADRADILLGVLRARPNTAANSLLRSALVVAENLLQRDSAVDINLPGLIPQTGFGTTSV